MLDVPPPPRSQRSFPPAGGSFDLVLEPWCENGFFKSAFFSVETLGNTAHLLQVDRVQAAVTLWEDQKEELERDQKIKSGNYVALWCIIVEVSF